MNVGKVYKLLIFIALVMTLGLNFGCADKKVQTEPMSSQGSQVGSGSSATAGTQDQEALMREKQLAEAIAKAQAILTDEKIYFEFDKYDIKPQFRDILKQKAEILKQYADFRVIIEGHCDERGTEEYNLALGERRARAVYEYLLLLNVSANQLEIVSYGEERPAVEGHDEAAWTKNRRAEFKVIK